MTAQEDSLAELSRLLDELHMPYVVIGGLANAAWGEPRATLDIDVTVWVAEAHIDAAIANLAARMMLEPRVTELATLLERPEIAARFADWKAEAGLTNP